MAKMTPEESNQQAMDFEAAFKEESPAKREMTEDEAFGLSEPAAEVPAVAEAQGRSTETPAAEEVSQAEPAAAPADQADEASSAASGGADGEPSAVYVEIDTAAADGTDVAPEGQGDEPTDPQDVQRAKSWEGRLKKREAELAAREAALAERETPAAQAGETAAGGEGSEPVAEAVAEAVDKVESGAMSPDQALNTLTEDFGPQFASLLTTLIEAKATEIAGRAADERMGNVSKTIDALVGEIVHDKQRDHFEAISDAHSDFVEVAESQGFKDWVQGMDEEDRAKALATIDNGSSRAIIKLISAYKDRQEEAPESVDAPPAAPEAVEGLDEAEGVRSSGVRLPEQPARAEGYEEAWDRF